MRIVEVGPRDGLQNETAAIPTDVKIAFVDALSAAGVDEIEVTAFVSPRWVPQLSDGEAVLGGITRRKGVVYSALVPNERGLDRAIYAGVDKVAVFTRFDDKHRIAVQRIGYCRFRHRDDIIFNPEGNTQLSKHAGHQTLSGINFCLRR